MFTNKSEGDTKLQENVSEEVQKSVEKSLDEEVIPDVKQTSGEEPPKVLENYPKKSSTMPAEDSCIAEFKKFVAKCAEDDGRKTSISSKEHTTLNVNDDAKKSSNKAVTAEETIGSEDSEEGGGSDNVTKTVTNHDKKEKPVTRRRSARNIGKRIRITVESSSEDDPDDPDDPYEVSDEEWRDGDEPPVLYKGNRRGRRRKNRGPWKSAVKPAVVERSASSISTTLHPAWDRPNDEPELIVPDKIVAPATSTTGVVKPVTDECFKPGSFVILKKDLELEENPQFIWKIDGKALLKKYLQKEPGSTLYKACSSYTGWTTNTKDLYAAVDVSYKIRSKKKDEEVVEYSREKITVEPDVVILADD